MRETLLEIKDLNVEVEGKYILKGLNLTIKKEKYMRLWDQWWRKEHIV